MRYKHSRPEPDREPFFQDAQRLLIFPKETSTSTKASSNDPIATFLERWIVANHENFVNKDVYNSSLYRAVAEAVRQKFNDGMLDDRQTTTP